jgi:integrase
VAGSHKRNEQDNCATLLKFFGDKTLVDDLRPKLLNQYHTWRVENVTKGEGHRTTDLKLNTLSNGLNWAVQEELIEQNPIKFRVRFHSSTNARHCRDLAPADVDELHNIARLLFGDKRSETLGWQARFEALTGLRTNEVLAMRLDARPDEPGGVTADGGSLCVRRSKKAGRDNPSIEVHEGLRQLITAHKIWHHQRYPKSPWYFPGREKEDGKPVSKGALTRTLERLHKEQDHNKPHLKKKFTSHGMRAFYVLVRRSQGATDAQIAWEINHVGGVSTLGKVYGGVPPHWLQGKGPKLSWIPKEKPARSF